MKLCTGPAHPQNKMVAKNGVQSFYLCCLSENLVFWAAMTKMKCFNIGLFWFTILVSIGNKISLLANLSLIPSLYVYDFALSVLCCIFMAGVPPVVSVFNS